MTPPPAFEVQDVLGLCRLEHRSPTLDGQVPLRAAQGCQPLLEGNALGVQVVLQKALVLHRSVGAWRIELDQDTRRAARAASPWLAQQDGLAEGWKRWLAGGPVLHSGLARGVVGLWTGLLVRPRTGVTLWLGRTRNRCHPRLEVAERLFTDAEAFVPLVLRLRLLPGAPAVVTLQHEVATLVALPSANRIHTASLEEGRHAAQAHLDFYSPAYFEQKKAKVTLAYRQRVGAVRGHPNMEDPAACQLTVVQAGPCAPQVGPLAPAEATDGPHVAGAPSPIHAATFHHTVGLRAVSNGHAVAVQADSKALATAAQQVEQTWQRVFGPQVLQQHTGALLYLTRLFNLHPPGEPWFFVKPFALGVTPPGWSTWLEGVGGPAHDALRGVVRTDAFHAMPVVFHMWNADKTAIIRPGQPMLRALPIPREAEPTPFGVHAPLSL